MLEWAVSQQETDQPFKAGFVAILGLPNAGKSTLINALLKTKLSIVSPKPQTTRHNILGILNGERWQICLLDTPGALESSRDGLQRALIRSVRAALHDDADAVILLVEPPPPDEKSLELLRGLRIPPAALILAVNKADTAKGAEVDATLKACSEALSPSAALKISARAKQGLDLLLAEIVRRLPESPAFYDTDQLSDRWERFFAAEIVRERIFELFEEEIPHACAVTIDLFREKPGSPDEIFATIHVERESQKGILIGKAGRKIRELAEKSRASLETFLGRPAALELRVSVRKNWRQDPRSLKEFGYLNP